MKNAKKNVTKEQVLKSGFSFPEYAMENRIPLKDQPLSDYRWVAFKKGFNTLPECAAFFKVEPKDLQREVRKLKKDRPMAKDISGCIDILCRRILVYEGKVITQAEIARRTGLSPSTVASRVRSGWSVGMIMQIPANQTISQKINAFGNEYESIAAFARAFAKPVSTVYSRIRSGMTPEEAVTKPIKPLSREKKMIICFGEPYETYAELAKEFGIKEGTLMGYMRKHKEMSLDDIVFDLASNPKALYAVNGAGYEAIADVARKYNINSSGLRKQIRKASGDDYMEDIVDGMVKRKKNKKGGKNIDRD